MTVGNTNKASNWKLAAKIVDPLAADSTHYITAQPTHQRNQTPILSIATFVPHTTHQLRYRTVLTLIQFTLPTKGSFRPPIFFHSTHGCYDIITSKSIG